MSSARPCAGNIAPAFPKAAPCPATAKKPADSASKTETFVALCAHVDNWRWAGVPFYLRTGKRLPQRSSEIVIQFRDVPHSIFAGNDLLANRLTIRLQPEEEISLLLMNKTPSLEQELKPLALNLSLSDAFKRGRAGASPMSACCWKR